MLDNLQNSIRATRTTLPCAIYSDQAGSMIGNLTLNRTPFRDLHALVLPFCPDRGVPFWALITAGPFFRPSEGRIGSELSRLAFRVPGGSKGCSPEALGILGELLKSAAQKRPYYFAAIWLDLWTPTFWEAGRILHWAHKK